jgi:toxin ParE1/3/4
MGWKIVFSPQALDDLAEVVRFIAQDDPLAAKRIGNELIDRVLILEKFPWLGSRYPKRNAVRKLVSRPYVIFYRIDEKTERVDILRYWHPARGEANFAE